MLVAESVIVYLSGNEGGERVSPTQTGSRNPSPVSSWFPVNLRVAVHSGSTQRGAEGKRHILHRVSRGL